VYNFVLICVLFYSVYFMSILCVFVYYVYSSIQRLAAIKRVCSNGMHSRRLVAIKQQNTNVAFLQGSVETIFR